MEPEPLKQRLPEFLFGKLSTEEGSLKQARIARHGFYYDIVLQSIDPKENEAMATPGAGIAILVKVGADMAIQGVTLYDKTDRTIPKPKSPGVSTIPMQQTKLASDTLEWCYLEE